MKVALLDIPREDVRLEIIPLIDVIFCILTFFILAAVGLTRQQAIDLDLPSAQTSQPLPGQGSMSDRLYVSVDSLGQVYLDQQPVPLDLLQDVLLQFNQANPSGLMVLYASRDARYEDVVTVLDVLRSIGGDRVALATLPKDLDLSNPASQSNAFPPGTTPNLPLDGSGLAPSQPTSPEEPSLPLEQSPAFGSSPSGTGGGSAWPTPSPSLNRPEQPTNP